jgi:hypothetical protein
MKKVILILIISLLMTAPVFATSLNINGNEVKSSTAPVQENGALLVPLRVVSENLGATIKWDPQKKSIAIVKDDIVIVMILDEYMMSKSRISTNETEYIRLTIAPKNVKGVTMVPLRAVSDALNCKVEYKDGVINITSEEIVVQDDALAIDYKKFDKPQFSNEDELGEYLIKNYSSVNTEIGEISFDISVYEDKNRNGRYDFSIDFDINSKDYYNIQYDKKYTNEQAKRVKAELKTFMQNVAKDIIEKMPGVKIKGGYDQSYYEYPTIRVGYVSVRYCSWQNYEESLFESKPVSTFRWMTILDDAQW